MIEINSLEWYTIITSSPPRKEGEKFANYTVVSKNVHRLDDGRVFVLNDDPPNTNHSRPLEELNKLSINTPLMIRPAPWEDETTYNKDVYKNRKNYPRWLRWLLRLLQRQCQHYTMKADILEGCGGDYQVRWCETCGAIMLIVDGTPSGNPRRPEPNWQ